MQSNKRATYVITAPPLRVGELTAGAAAVAPVALFVATVVAAAVVVIALLTGGVDSDFGDPFEMVEEFRFMDDVLIAVELRTLMDVRLFLLDGGGG